MSFSHRFKVKVYSSSVAVVQRRHCLIEEFILLQSTSPEASVELNDPPSSKVCCSNHVSDEQSTLWSADSKTAMSCKSLSSVEVKIESYLQEPNQPRNCSLPFYWLEKQALYPILTI